MSCRWGVAGWCVHEQMHVVVLITRVSPRTVLSSYVCGFQFARFETHRTGVSSCHRQEVLAQEARLFGRRCRHPLPSASKQLPLSLLLFNNFLSFIYLFVFVLHWSGHVYTFRRLSLNHLGYRFVCFFEWCPVNRTGRIQFEKLKTCLCTTSYMLLLIIWHSAFLQFLCI